MRLLIAFLLPLFSLVVSAQDARSTKNEVDRTIDRGLAFLAKDALAWKANHNCVSCHHASLVICSMRDARQFGRAIDEPLLAELTKWIAESGNGKFAMERPATAPHAASPKAIYFATALGMDPTLDAAGQAGLKLLLSTVKEEQTENGSWSTWPGTRPPLFGSSDETLTLLATLALLPAATAGDEDAKTARDRAVKWLTETMSDEDPQSIALRLILWTKLGRPQPELTPLIQSIQARQNADGGWSQSTEMASDAWASGQALYALSSAGIQSTDASIARGQTFLVKTQGTDGSWTMTSRPIVAGGQGSNSLIPITGGGNAWAILGLVRSAHLANFDSIAE